MIQRGKTIENDLFISLITAFRKEPLDMHMETKIRESAINGIFPC